jgi:hypothetical protein
VNHHDICRKSNCPRFCPVPRGGTSTLFCLRGLDKTVSVEACGGDNWTITETAAAKLIYDVGFKPPKDCEFRTEHLMVDRP